MEIGDRISEYASKKGITIAEFERISGLGNGYVRKIRNTIGRRKLEDIMAAFPDLNKVWLLTGEGEMLNTTENTATANGAHSVAAINSHVTLESNEILKERVKYLEELLAEKERLIKVLLKNNQG